MRESRIVQYKMSLKGGVFPTQDEPEIDEGRTRHTAGECKLPCSLPNISRRPRSSSFSTPAPLSALPAPAARRFTGWSNAPCAPASTRVCRKRQGNRAPLSGQNQRTQPVANHPLDRPLARARRHRAARFPAAPLPRRYTPDDIARLAAVDAAHEGLSGPAVRRILQREFEVYGKTDYQRLASISASHIYNLRRTRAYREHHVHHTKTRAAAVSIGERRKPDPRGRPVTCGSTPCTRATPKPARGCITSTPSTRSRNGRWWAVAKPSPRPI